MYLLCSIINKKYRKLDNSIKFWILKYLKKLESVENPKSFEKSLYNNFKNLWRYRVDNFRIIAEIKNEELIILIIEIGKRSNVYKNLKIFTKRLEIML